MKSKYWIGLLAVVLVASLGLSVFLMAGGESAELAEIKNGDTRFTVVLAEDQEFTLQSPDGGFNTVTVRDGKIAVTDADCPDRYCVKQGFCNSGEQIVCLPHKLVISFVGESEIDGAVG